MPENLLTAEVMLDNKRGKWLVTWAGDGVWPKDLRASTLTEAVEQVAVAAAGLYARYPPNPEAELQVAIYPWTYRRGPMYDISVGPDGYSAHDLHDDVPAIQGATLEDLVAAAEHTPGAGIDHCMFRRPRNLAAGRGRGQQASKLPQAKP